MIFHIVSSSFSHPDFHCRLQLLTESTALHEAQRVTGSKAVSRFITAGRDFHPAPKDTIDIYLSLCVIIAAAY